MLDWILSLPWWGWVIIIFTAWVLLSPVISLIAARIVGPDDKY